MREQEATHGQFLRFELRVFFFLDQLVYHIYQPLGSRRIWHIVNF